MKGKKYVLKFRFKFFLILLFMGYFGIAMLKQGIKLDHQNTRIEDLKNEIAETEEQNHELERLISYTDSEEYIEKVARERLGWVKKGEIIFIQEKNN